MEEQTVKEIMGKSLEIINSDDEKNRYEIKTFIIFFVDIFNELLVLCGEIAKNYCVCETNEFTIHERDGLGMYIWLNIYNNDAKTEYLKRQPIQIIIGASEKTKQRYFHTPGFVCYDFTSSDILWRNDN